MSQPPSFSHRLQCSCMLLKVYSLLPHLKTHSTWDSLPHLKTHSKCEWEIDGELPARCCAVLEFHVPARRIGQRWRATRAPSSVSIRMGRAKRSALSAAHPVLRKALNSWLRHRRLIREIAIVVALPQS